jgi:hypothetical protein
MEEPRPYWAGQVPQSQRRPAHCHPVCAMGQCVGKKKIMRYIIILSERDRENAHLTDAHLTRGVGYRGISPRLLENPVDFLPH